MSAKPTTKVTGSRRAKPMSKNNTAKDKFGMTPAMYARLDAMTDAEVEAAARTDPDNPPLTAEQASRMRRVAVAKRIRWQLGMSQSEFSEAFGIPLGTLRDWEQHRREPDQGSQAYLAVIAHEPDAVRRALAERAKEVAQP